MKNLLFVLITFFCLNSRAGIVIDSVSKDTACLHTFVRVYCHTYGTITPGNPLVLYFNGYAVINGTYQQLIDSNYVWGFVIPLGTYPGYDTWAAIDLANAVTTQGNGSIWLLGCDAWAGIKENTFSGKILSVKYTSLIGETLKELPVNQIAIKETQYEIGTKREKVFITPE